MKTSREWLQTYFDKPLPEAQALAEALTLHSFEIESIESYRPRRSIVDHILDVKATPNRGHDCLSHRGIAKELSAILKLSMKNDPLRASILLGPKTDAVRVRIEDERLCPRFTGAYIRDVRVGPSPDWLKERLEAVGQKSINNIVDVTNFVMFDIGQPLHAFDVEKLKEKDGARALFVRLAKKGETLMGLDDKEYTLAPSMLVIADANAGAIASVAGIKGGKPTGIDEKTTGIFLEAANWDGVTIRKTSQALKLRTDASDRFQQVISPEFAAHGLAAAAELIAELAGGKVVGYVDEYPVLQKPRSVSVSTERVNAVLGTKLSDADVADAFTRLDLPFEKKGDIFAVAVPFERLDLGIPEDLIEEVARIVGYDKIPPGELPPFPKKPEVNANFYAAEKIREELMTKGYSEVYTSVFAEKGEREVLNKVGGEKPYLRMTLKDGLTDSYERNVRHKDLLGIGDVQLFEIGTIWKGGKERLVVGSADKTGAREAELKPVSSGTYDDLPVSNLERYHPFSRFPFITRDVSLWVPNATKPEDVESVIRGSAKELLIRAELFDRFEKGGELSLAFRLVFQSFERTLTDEEANMVMEKVYAAVKERGWDVR